MRTRANTGDVLAFWQPRSTRRLRDCEARQITSNMDGFIHVLLDWEKKERSGITPDKIVDSEANDKEE
jgi:hypothetical protein